jgi:hypothetical protein
MEKKMYYHNEEGSEVHLGREWDSNESSTDSSNGLLPGFALILLPSSDLALCLEFDLEPYNLHHITRDVTSLVVSHVLR